MNLSELDDVLIGSAELGGVFQKTEQGWEALHQLKTVSGNVALAWDEGTPVVTLAGDTEVFQKLRFAVSYHDNAHYLRFLVIDAGGAKHTIEFPISANERF